MYRVTIIDQEDGRVIFKREQFSFAFLFGPTTIADVQAEALKIAASEGCIKFEDFGKYDVRAERND